jgi:hypothetical protein
LNFKRFKFEFELENSRPKLLAQIRSSFVMKYVLEVVASNLKGDSNELSQEVNFEVQ